MAVSIVPPTVKDVWSSYVGSAVLDMTYERNKCWVSHVAFMRMKNWLVYHGCWLMKYYRWLVIDNWWTMNHNRRLMVNNGRLVDYYVRPMHDYIWPMIYFWRWMIYKQWPS